MNRIVSILLVLVLYGLPSDAAVIKCSDADGEIVYTNVACPDGFRPEGAGASAAPLSPSGTPNHPSKGNSFLWAVKGPGNTVFLLGTLHLATADLYPLDKGIENAYLRSAVVAFETNLDDMSSSAHQTRLMTNGLYLDGTTLRDHLSPRAYELLSKKITAAGLTHAQMVRFKPWLTALTVTAATLQELGFDPKYGLDRHFLTKSRKDGKSQVFLESAEFQLSLFTELEGRLQESFLEKTMKELDQVESLYSELMHSWKMGDSEKVGQLLMKSFEKYPRIYDRFVLRRNKQWFSQIENFLNMEDDVFVVVGAGHLSGREGLIARLHAKGYTVTQK